MPSVATAPEARTFEAVLRQNPDDLITRLVYADWLDEHDDPAACDQRLAVQLRAIKAAPEEYPPRLVYADICERYGRNLRARFIRDSCATHAIGDPVARREAMGKLLVDARGLALLPDRSELDDETTATIRGGFIEKLRATPRDWFRHGPALLAAHPLRRVELTARPEIIFSEIRFESRAPEQSPDGIGTFTHYWFAAPPEGVPLCFDITGVIGEAEQWSKDVRGTNADKARAMIRRTHAARTVEGYLAARWPEIALEVPRAQAEAEAETFPRGRNDDMVDSINYASRMLEVRQFETHLQAAGFRGTGHALPLDLAPRVADAGDRVVSLTEELSEYLAWAESQPHEATGRHNKQAEALRQLIAEARAERTRLMNEGPHELN